MWKPCVFSDKGKLQIFDNYAVSNLGIVKNVKTGRELANHFRSEKNGYISTQLNKDGRAKLIQAHRLVCAVHNGPADCESLIVHHKNGVKNDNRADNLEWCSRKANAIEHHLANRKMNKFHGRAILQYNLVGELVKEYESITMVKKSSNFSGLFMNI